MANGQSESALRAYDPVGGGGAAPRDAGSPAIVDLSGGESACTG